MCEKTLFQLLKQTKENGSATLSLRKT